ncbi:MAG: putative CRISPR-associated protein [Trichlorobacter sp.]|uniref:putative CRISPR-associated protein n=1 Tax=Trichlorobacter sp. TaxID=2911007 RepID=UPI0025668F93|nr:putative CRISPR-associated protein [Trichlorobacter sp.]MDK9719452.1 putative CRISPR-associated protein [Trichlorobacter sp.]
MITYICTVGTSIVTATGLDLSHFAKWKLADEDSRLQSILEAEHFALQNIKKKTDAEFPRVSAELNSLIKMGLKPTDRVVLIATETIEGKMCAELLRKVLLEKELCHDVIVEVIDGLQAQDGKRFQQVGLKKLISFITKYEHENVVFNPTGGFKSVVPYITLAGMLFNKPVKYIHEFSDDVITLANIPIRYDEEVFFEVEDKLQKIDSNTCIGKQEWQRGIAFNDSRFATLVEEIDGKLTMSGIGQLLWEKFKVDFPETLRDEVKQLENKRKQPDFFGIIQKHFSQLELSDSTLQILKERSIDHRVIKCLHSIDHRQTTPGMRWHTFEGGENLWYARFSGKGRIYVQMRPGLSPLVTAIDYDKKLQ